MGLENGRDLDDLDADDLLKLTEQPRKRRKVYEEDNLEAYNTVNDGDQDSDSHEDDEDDAHPELAVHEDEMTGSSANEDEETETTKHASPIQRMKNGPSVARMLKRPLNEENAQDIVMNMSKSSASKEKTFLELGVSKALVASLTKMSIRKPTEVQAACIPPLLAGKDCVGNAKTGSGKTVAFALPILQKLSVDPYGIFALVLTPTRELAFQIAEQFAVLGAPLNIQTAVIVGGMDMIAQSLELNSRPHVVVATPGRIVDHLKSSSGEWDLSRVRFLVLDEADRLLTSTFAPELAYLFNALSKDRQTCLFTATMTESIEDIISAPPKPGKEKPFVHRMSTTVETVDTLKQYYILVPSHVREPYLFHLLCNPPDSIAHLRQAPPEPTKRTNRKRPKSGSNNRKSTTADDELTIEQPPPTIIFCARARTAAFLSALLQQLGIRAAALHARLTQRARLTALGLFRAHVVPVLVCTDVGARGLDVADVALVINWDVPRAPEEYTHRVGRTARAGRAGAAVSFVTERDESSVLAIEDRIKTKLTEMTMSEEKVLEKLNAVSTAKRVANMELHDSDFGKREEIYKIKDAKRKRVSALKDAQQLSTS